ncbi:hypothetical protein SAMN05192533_105160 [Mesobacillus persicus]|uniref:Uncharacterized protein n=1 Tax=Mesobacillus persicus TaxID=930146 RepID=A0A1H8AXW9_9BACI|nr:hypothetical protein [Mesobacillus persicus]SEM74337.1 hypothetical protein SAMN05192533_105160 [Mesobacillus persicus]
MYCKVKNGYAEIGDIVTRIDFYGESGVDPHNLYKVTEFDEYQGIKQVRFRRLKKGTLEFLTANGQLAGGDMMSFDEATFNLRIIEKAEKTPTFWSKLIKMFQNK